MATAFERQLKRLGLFGLSRLAKSAQAAPTTRELDAIQRILVVRPDERIGNAILIIPLLNALKSRFPEAQLSLVMSRRYWDLREFIPTVDEFIDFDKKHYARNPFAFVGFIRRLRRGQYDLVFDAAGDHSVSFTHLALTACSGGRFRVGHDRGEAGRFYEVSVSVATADRHETERHLDLLRAIAPGNYEARPLLKVIADNGYADRLWREGCWSENVPTVIIHPGARGHKRWPADSFAEVANQLTAHGFQVGVLWGPSDTDAATAMMKMASAKVKTIGVIAFRDFVSVIRKADVFFSGDCGPMHLAAACPPRRGVVTVFVIDKSARYGPLGADDVSIVDDGVHPRIDEIVARIERLAAKDQDIPTKRSALA